METADRTIRDLTQKYKQSQTLDAATIARKTKEMEVVMRKINQKDFNYALFSDDIKNKVGDSQVATISSLNE